MSYATLNPKKESMPRQHIATHAYDSQQGWVRVPRKRLTYENVAHLRAQGFTMVRSRRGLFGSRELPLSWYAERRPIGGAEVLRPRRTS